MEIGKSMRFEDSLKGLLAARDEHGPDSLALFHSRIATHGTVDEFNVHPFWVGNDTVVAHNGILPAEWHPTKNDKRSDTQILADRTLADYLSPISGVPSRRRGKELGKRIGYGNKLVILSVLSGLPKARIINAHEGIHHGGVWYSNSGFRDYTDWRGWQGWRDEDWWEVGSKKRVYSWDPKDTEEEEYESVKAYYDGSCDACEAIGFVNVDTDHCEMCLTCTVCYNESQHCRCYWSDGSRVTDYYDWDAWEEANGGEDPTEESEPASSKALAMWVPQEVDY